MIEFYFRKCMNCKGLFIRKGFITRYEKRYNMFCSGECKYSLICLKSKNLLL